MVHTSVVEWQKHIPDVPQYWECIKYWEVIRDDAITHYSIHSTGGPGFSREHLVHRVERFTIYDLRFTVYDNVMYGRVLMCETGLLMALVSFSGIQFDQNVRAHSGIRKQALISGFLYAGSPSM